jgi:CDP-6-deoxy-D-xylo-4-hexulose-3-dehydrase
LPSEISAAFALVQLKKLKNNIAIRNKNFDYLKKYFKQYSHLFDLPEQYPGVITPWLAFPLVLKKNKYFKRKKLQIYLEKNNIQTRTIFTGNILKQPIMKLKKFKKINNAEAVSNNVMENGILIGCHQDLKMKDLKFITRTFDKFLKRYLI